MTYIEQGISEEDWNKLTAEERHRFVEHLCLRCGKRITGQPYLGSLCLECNMAYIEKQGKEWASLDNDEDYSVRFLAFVRDRKEQVQFT